MPPFDCVFAREAPAFETSIARLTAKQLKTLRALAANPSARVFSNEFMEQARVQNPGAMKKAITRFLADRLIFERRGEYCFFNPFFAEWLKTRL